MNRWLLWFVVAGGSFAVVVAAGAVLDRMLAELSYHYIFRDGRFLELSLVWGPLIAAGLAATAAAGSSPPLTRRAAARGAMLAIAVVVASAACGMLAGWLLGRWEQPLATSPMPRPRWRACQGLATGATLGVAAASMSLGLLWRRARGAASHPALRQFP